MQLKTHLIEVRGKQQEAVFELLGPNCEPIDTKVMHYDFLHVTPPQGPLDVVAHSELANAEGWVDVDQEVGMQEAPGCCWLRGCVLAQEE